MYTLVFENEDGTKTLYNYGHPVKYVENEKVIDKDNTLKKTLYKLQTYYSNSQNNIVSYLPQKLNKPIHMDLDGFKVSIRPQEIKETDKAVVENDSITYPNAYGPSTALKYTAIYSGLKEEILLSKYTGQTEFAFLVDIGDCVIRTLDDDCLYIYDEKSKTYRGLIEPVYIEDATGKIETNNELTYQQTDTTEWLITVKANKNFLESPKTVYPVSIDPTITHANTSVHDATVYSGEINSNYGTSGSLFIGRKPTSQGTCRVLMKFPNLSIPSNITASLINYAYIELRDLQCEEESMIVQCYPFTGNEWDESSVTWVNSNMNATSFSSLRLLDEKEISYQEGQDQNFRYSFNIKEAVKEWTHFGFGSKHKGIVFRSSKESQTYYKTFGSYNRAEHTPQLSITYGAPSPRTIPDGTYYIRNRESNKYLDVMNGGTTSGTNVTQWSFNGYLPQQWKIIRQNDGYYTLKPQHTTGVALDVKDNYSEQGSLIDIWSISTAQDYHKFLIEPVETEDGETVYKISTKVSNDKMCLTVLNGSMENSASIAQIEYVEAPTQEWYFESNIFSEGHGYLFSPTEITPTTGYESSNIKVNIYCNAYYEPLVEEAISIWNNALGEGNGISISIDNTSPNIIKTDIWGPVDEDDSPPLAVYEPKATDSNTNLTTRFHIVLYEDLMQSHCLNHNFYGEQMEKEIVAAFVHEFGHALGLADYLLIGVNSVMSYSTTRQNLCIPQKEDVAGVYAYDKLRR